LDISQFLKRAVLFWPDREAVVDGAHRFNYRQLHKRACGLSSALLARGVARGQVVSIVSPNSHEYIEAYFACAMTGIILNPINFRLSAREIAAIVTDAGSVAVLVHSDFFEIVENAIKIAETSMPSFAPVVIAFGHDNLTRKITSWLDYEVVVNAEPLSIPADLSDFAHDVANLYYTSGTTGAAKGVMLTYENISCHALCVISELQLSDEDHWLHAAPLFHLADAWAAFAITAVGGKHIILPYFNSQNALEIIEREKVTLSNLIPTMLNAMVNDPSLSDYSYSSLRLILSGGAPISPETVRKIIQAFSCDYVQTYGMTETSPYLTMSLPKAHLMGLPADELLTLRSKTGRPFMGVELKVVRSDMSEVAHDDKEVGEIIARGPIVTPGYWNKPEETAAAIQDGWLHTGDLAVIDSEGYLNIVDRKKDMILTGGENVYSTEVEHVLYEHLAILECAVFGLPDATWGESVTAAVVLKKGHFVSGTELIAFVKSRIAHYKAPRHVEFLDALPKTGSGKIQKKALRERQIV
jgi:fatty-acyl-CoA synthase